MSCLTLMIRTDKQVDGIEALVVAVAIQIGHSPTSDIAIVYNSGT